MTQIGPAQIVRILASLSKPAGNAGTSATTKTAATRTSGPEGHPGPIKKSASSLKSRLRNRLAAVDRNAADYEQQTSLITVQEIVLWEFGDDILNHPQFGTVAEKVTQALTSDPALKEALSRAVENLVQLSR